MYFCKNGISLPTFYIAFCIRVGVYDITWNLLFYSLALLSPPTQQAFEAMITPLLLCWCLWGVCAWERGGKQACWQSLTLSRDLIRGVFDKSL